MNRKNLTAAVLAGLAGAAGLAGTAQAVNMNPDGLGQVLIYPYYTSDAGNDTLLSVVNTTHQAKAVKVRFKEGYNSREVLDFNLYMSKYDVWVAAISDNAGTPTLYIPDSSCTVPYLYEQDGTGGAYEPGESGYYGMQAFLPYAYTGKNADEGPTTIDRAAEGHFEMIEMGTLVDEDTEDLAAKPKVYGSAYNVTHQVDNDTGYQLPYDCESLVDAWTRNPDGYWIDDQSLDIRRNSGGLFGGAAIINVGNGTMFSYDAKAIQGFDKSDDGHLHAEPGDLDPNLNSGDQTSATIFFGVPKDEAVTFYYSYNRSIDAISAVFMHEFTMNEYNIQSDLNAASEWVITFPTKNYYVDESVVDTGDTEWIPDSDDPGCGGWEPGDFYPERNGPDYDDQFVQDGAFAECTYVEIDIPDAPVPPFTSVWDGEACEPFGYDIWDREENADDGANNSIPPVVSPRPPGGGGGNDDGEICYETNVLRFGNDGVFVPVFGTTSDLLLTVDTGAILYDNGTMSKPRLNGWARINWYHGDEILDSNGHRDASGLVGLPVTGFWALQFTNGYLGTPEASVLANYGGLFQHKGNVRSVCPDYCENND